MKRKEGEGEKKKAILVLFGLNWLCFQAKKLVELIRIFGPFKTLNRQEYLENFLVE